MKMYELSFTGMIIRFYIMMTIILIAGFAGSWAIALLSLPVFLSTILGMKKKVAETNPA